MTNTKEEKIVIAGYYFCGIWLKYYDTVHTLINNIVKKDWNKARINAREIRENVYFVSLQIIENIKKNNKIDPTINQFIIGQAANCSQNKESLTIFNTLAILNNIGILGNCRLRKLMFASLNKKNLFRNWLIPMEIGCIGYYGSILSNMHLFYLDSKLIHDMDEVYFAEENFSLQFEINNKAIAMQSALKSFNINKIDASGLQLLFYIESIPRKIAILLAQINKKIDLYPNEIIWQKLLLCVSKTARTSICLYSYCFYIFSILAEGEYSPLFKIECNRANKLKFTSMLDEIETVNFEQICIEGNNFIDKIIAIEGYIKSTKDGYFLQSNLDDNAETIEIQFPCNNFGAAGIVFPSYCKIIGTLHTSSNKKPNLFKIAKIDYKSLSNLSWFDRLNHITESYFSVMPKKIGCSYSYLVANKNNFSSGTAELIRICNLSHLNYS